MSFPLVVHLGLDGRCGLAGAELAVERFAPGQELLWHGGVPEGGPGQVVAVRPVGQQLRGQALPLHSRQSRPGDQQ